jgi:hypothetical protein
MNRFLFRFGFISKRFGLDFATLCRTGTFRPLRGPSETLRGPVENVGWPSGKAWVAQGSKSPKWLCLQQNTRKWVGVGAKTG